VGGVVKQYGADSSTSVQDAPHSSCPTKISSLIQQQVKALVEDNPQA